MNNIVIAEGYAVMRIVQRKEEFSTTIKEIMEAFTLSNDETTLVAESVIESLMGIGNDPSRLDKMEVWELLDLYVKYRENKGKGKLRIRDVDCPSSLVGKVIVDYFTREVK